MPGNKGGLCYVLAALITPLSMAQPLAVRASHSLAIARPAEMVAVPWTRVLAALPGALPQKLVVRDGAGRSLPYQVTKPDYDARGIRAGFADLLFQYDFGAGEQAADFTVDSSAAIVAPFPSRTFARIVPERLDDFAWENDRIGHRAYGPALGAPDSGGVGKEVLVASGIDVWSKRVRYPVIDRWYANGSYHRDDGEGMDMYKTGASRGTGGTGVWDGERLHVSANFARWKIIANGPLRSIFELAYDGWDAGGVRVAETKRFTVDAGHNLDLVESTFTFDGPQELTVALGITSNSAEKGQAAGTSVHRLPRLHALAQWEVRKSNGALGTALIVPEGITGFAEDAVNQLILARVAPGRPLRYYAGAGWTGGGDFPGREAWLAYVADAAARAGAPLTLTYPAK